MTQTEEITAHLSRTLCEHSRVDFDSVPPVTTLIDEFALDSLDIVHVLMDVEKTMRLSFEDKGELHGVNDMTIEQFAQWLQARIKNVDPEKI